MTFKIYQIDCPFAESGVCGALFSMLDIESDEVLRKGVKDTLTSIITAATSDKQELQVVISLCKSILTCGNFSIRQGISC